MARARARPRAAQRARRERGRGRGGLRRPPGPSRAQSFRGSCITAGGAARGPGWSRRHGPVPARPRPAAARRGEGARCPGPPRPPGTAARLAGAQRLRPSARLARPAPGEPARSRGHVLGGGPAAAPAPATARPGTAAPAAGPEGRTMNPAAAAPPPGQQVIHVTQDLDTELEALFNAVMNPRPSSWRKKILPESFFREPDSGSHSRQSSTDSGGPPPRLAPVHVRSHSSPASLPGAGAAPQHGHLRQRSCDVTDERPLPPGWEMALTQTGQRYFLKWVRRAKRPGDRGALAGSRLRRGAAGWPPGPGCVRHSRGEIPSRWEERGEGEVLPYLLITNFFPAWPHVQDSETFFFFLRKSWKAVISGSFWNVGAELCVSVTCRR